jgi:DHA2 family multidrug resistance protein-like MFS transporter
MGVAAATLAPSTLSLIRDMFLDPRQRTVAIGVWVTSFSAGAAAGPLLGGLLLNYFWWGSVFLIAVPAITLAAIAAAVLRRAHPAPRPSRTPTPVAATSFEPARPARPDHAD